MARRASSPADLDPLDAAASPINNDPAVRVNTAQGSADQTAVRQAYDKLRSRGIDHGTAVAMAEQYVLDHKQGASDEFNRNRTKGRAAPPAPKPPEEPDVSPEQIRDAGFMPQAEPGPRMVGAGSKVAQGKKFDKMSEAAGYIDRIPVTDANRSMARPDAAYMPSQRDRDMMARGFYPVYAPDGSVSYSVGTGADAQTTDDLGRRGIPGGLGRNGPRADLEPGFDLNPVLGPTGTNYIYQQNDAAQDLQTAYMDERQRARFADASGVSEADLAKMTPEQQRAAVRSAKREDANSRKDAWRSQMMLAGSNGRKNAVNAYNQLGDPDVSDWQKAVMANRLAPDMDNTTPLTVDAMGAQNALRFLNSANLGANMFNPMAQAAQQAQIDQMNSQKPAEEQVPLHKDKPGIHPAELTYADDYTGQLYSSGRGMLGISSEFTIAEQQAVIDHLVRAKGYSLDKAQKIVDEIARRRNSQSWMGSPQGDPATGAAAPTTPTAVPPPPGGRMGM